MLWLWAGGYSESRVAVAAGDCRASLGWRTRASALHGLKSRYGPCTICKGWGVWSLWRRICLLYTSDAADDLLCVDLGDRRIIKKKNRQKQPHKKYCPLFSYAHIVPNTPPPS